MQPLTPQAMWDKRTQQTTLRNNKKKSYLQRLCARDLWQPYLSSPYQLSICHQAHPSLLHHSSQIGACLRPVGTQSALLSGQPQSLRTLDSEFSSQTPDIPANNIEHSDRPNIGIWQGIHRKPGMVGPRRRRRRRLAHYHRPQ